MAIGLGSTAKIKQVSFHIGIGTEGNPSIEQTQDDVMVMPYGFPSR
jgi:hypothetical protein